MKPRTRMEDLKRQIRTDIAILVLALGGILACVGTASRLIALNRRVTALEGKQPPPPKVVALTAKEAYERSERAERKADRALQLSRSAHAVALGGLPEAVEQGPVEVVRK